MRIYIAYFPLSANTRFIFNRLSVSVTGKPFRDKMINLMKRFQPIFADCAAFNDKVLVAALRPIGRTRVYLLPLGYVIESIVKNRLLPLYRRVLDGNGSGSQETK